MGRAVASVERMAENSLGNNKVVCPAELGRAEWSLETPPSTVGLKVLLLLVSAVGDAAADEMIHEVPAAALRDVPGLHGMSRVELEGVLLGLIGIVARLDVRDLADPERRSVAFSPVVSYVHLDFRDDGLLGLRFRFGEVFRQIIADSELFAVLDRTLALSMKSRYALLLYQFLATHWRKQWQHQLKMPLPDLRRLFAVQADAYSEFSDFNRRVLQAAVKEVSASSPFVVSAKPYREGSRAVSGVVLSWKAKPAAKAKASMAGPSGASGSGRSVAAPKAKPDAKPAAKPASRRKASGRPALAVDADSGEVLAYHADRIKRRLPGVSGMSSGLVHQLVAAGLVSDAEVRAAGLPPVEGAR